MTVDGMMTIDEVTREIERVLSAVVAADRASAAKASQGRLLLCGLQPHVKEVFEISGFLKLLDIVDERTAAVRQLSAA